MRTYLENKFTGEKVDLSDVERGKMLTKVGEMFHITNMHIISHIDLDDYARNKKTSRIVIHFGLDDWVIKDDLIQIKGEVIK